MNNITNKGRKNSASANLNRSLIVLLTITVFLIGIATVVSMQSGQAQSAKVEEKTDGGRTPVTNQNTKGYVTTNEDGDIVMLDRQTGQTRGLTAQEERRLADALKEMLSHSTEGLVEVKREDGSVSVDLQGRFQNVIVAAVEADGTVTHACVDNHLAAAAFFDIDPKLLGINARRTKNGRSFARIEDR